MADEFTKAALYGIKTFTNKANEKVKKEIGVEKIKALLYEYYGEPSGHYMSYSDQWNSFYYHSEIGNEVIEHIPSYYLISKKFGFIKWLVENKKIAYDTPNNSDLYKCFELACVPLDNTDYITMLLSIQDEPIEFLVSVLK